jgi:hypothetical protein
MRHNKVTGYPNIREARKKRGEIFMLKRRSIGVVVTPEVITALVIEKTFIGRASFSFDQQALPKGSISDLSGTIADISSFERSVKQLLPSLSKWSLGETRIYLVLPQRLFYHSVVEIAEKHIGMKSDKLLASGALKLPGDSEQNVHGIYVDVNAESSRALLVTARAAHIQNYLSVFKREDRAIERVISPEISGYQFWSLVRPEVTYARALLFRAFGKVASLEVWDRAMLVYQNDFPSDLEERDLNLGDIGSCGAEASSAAPALSEVSKIVKRYREQGEPIQEVLVSGRESGRVAILSALSNEHGIKIFSARSQEEPFQATIIRDDSCALELALGAMPLVIGKSHLIGAHQWTR